jgi:hypothetical protein
MHLQKPEIVARKKDFAMESWKFNVLSKRFI